MRKLNGRKCPFGTKQFLVIQPTVPMILWSVVWMLRVTGRVPLLKFIGIYYIHFSALHLILGYYGKCLLVIDIFLGIFFTFRQYLTSSFLKMLFVILLPLQEPVIDVSIVDDCIILVVCEAGAPEADVLYSVLLPSEYVRMMCDRDCFLLYQTVMGNPFSFQLSWLLLFFSYMIFSFPLNMFPKFNGEPVLVRSSAILLHGCFYLAPILQWLYLTIIQRYRLIRLLFSLFVSSHILLFAWK